MRVAVISEKNLFSRMSKPLPEVRGKKKILLVSKIYEFRFYIYICICVSFLITYYFSLFI